MYQNNISPSAGGAEILTCSYIQDKNTQRVSMLLVTGLVLAKALDDGVCMWYFLLLKIADERVYACIWEL